MHKVCHFELKNPRGISDSSNIGDTWNAIEGIN